MRNRLAIVMAVYLMPVIAQASSLSAEENVYFNFNDNSFTNPCFHLGAPVSCSGTATVPGMSSQLNYNTFASTSYGKMGVMAQMSITPGSITSGTQAVNANQVVNANIVSAA